MMECCSNGPTIWDQIRDRLNAMEAARMSRADPAALREKLAKRARMLHDRTDAGPPAGPQLTYLAFTKGRERYGIPLEDVVEIQLLEQFSVVPGAPAFILGVVHFRGVLVSLLDLGLLLDIPASGLADVHALIVAEAAGKRIGVAASQVEEIVNVPTDQLNQAPDLPGRTPPDWIVGVHDETRIIVRTAQIVNDAELLR